MSDKLDLAVGIAETLKPDWSTYAQYDLALDLIALIEAVINDSKGEEKIE